MHFLQQILHIEWKNNTNFFIRNNRTVLVTSHWHSLLPWKRTWSPITAVTSPVIHQWTQHQLYFTCSYLELFNCDCSLCENDWESPFFVVTEWWQIFQTDQLWFFHIMKSCWSLTECCPGLSRSVQMNATTNKCSFLLL